MNDADNIAGNMVEYNRQLFIDTYNQTITREGSKNLLEWLTKTDFFTAPASTKYHCAYEGGLCLHSLNVYHRLKKLIEDEYGDDAYNKYPLETIAISGLLHDICKVEYYKTDFRNVKVDGKWEQKPYYTVDEKIPYGHGEKSVYIVGGFMRLTREEAMAINWHMGGFDMRVRGGSQAVSLTYDKFTLALFLHLADLMATYVDENRDLV